VLTALGVLSGPWALGRSRASPLLVLGLVVVLTVGAVPSRSFAWPPPDWRVVACDGGQGDGLVLASGHGRAVLVDVGPEGGGVDGCLRRLGVETLDAIVLTHFHDDHVGDLAAAIDGREVGRVLVTPVAEPEWAARQVREVAAERSIPVRTVTAGESLTWGEATATTWWPARRVPGGSVANNASIVLHVRVAEVSALLLGDIEQEAGRALRLALRRDPAMAAAAADLDVVKMPHHGSSNLDEGFMDEVAAPVALVSVGADNTYGHPTPSALARARGH